MWPKPKTNDSQHLGYPPVRTASTSHQKYQNEKQPSRRNTMLLDTLALGILFLALTIVATKNQNLGLWKSAILPVLNHGLDDELLDEYQNKQATASVMDQSAQSVDVKRDISDSRDKLVLRKQS